MQEPALIGDIGGTHARFALTDLAAASPQILHEQTFGDDRFASLQDAALDYLGQAGVKPTRAALAIASPITSDQINFTNRAWSFKCSELQHALGLDRLQVLNDFGAIGWAVPHLDASLRLPMHGESHDPIESPVSLIGPGTGFGVGLVIGSREQGWNVVETEGGHAGFAPMDDEERAIVRWIEARHRRVHNELVLSGSGLSRIDAALRGLAVVPAPAPQPGLRSPKDIVEAALHGNDHDALRALDRFCAIFGSVAGDAAMFHGARTVLIAGGVVMHFLDYLLGSRFMQRFLDRADYTPYMQRIAVQVITHPNPGLLGAAVALRHPHRAGA